MKSKQEETKESVSEEPAKKTYLDKCKLAGRIGPSITKIEQNSENANDFKFFGYEGLTIESIS